MNNVVTML